MYAEQPPRNWVAIGNKCSLSTTINDAVGLEGLLVTVADDGASWMRAQLGGAHTVSVEKGRRYVVDWLFTTESKVIMLLVFASCVFFFKSLRCFDVRFLSVWMLALSERTKARWQPTASVPSTPNRTSFGYRPMPIDSASCATSGAARSCVSSAPSSWRRLAPTCNSRLAAVCLALALRCMASRLLNAIVLMVVMRKFCCTVIVLTFVLPVDSCTHTLTTMAFNHTLCRHRSHVVAQAMAARSRCKPTARYTTRRRHTRGRAMQQRRRWSSATDKCLRRAQPVRPYRRPTRRYRRHPATLLFVQLFDVSTTLVRRLRLHCVRVVWR
jgi:hypothetical protein